MSQVACAQVKEQLRLTGFTAVQKTDSADFPANIESWGAKKHPNYTQRSHGIQERNLRMMNSRQMGVVESLIWLVVVLCASVLAMGVFLLISILGVAMLLAGMASQAVHSIFGGSPQRRVIFQHHSQGQYSQRPETRATIVEGEVLRRPK